MRFVELVEGLCRHAPLAHAADGNTPPLVLVHGFGRVEVLALLLHCHSSSEAFSALRKEAGSI
jgi:hypothetical protein